MTDNNTMDKDYILNKLKETERKVDNLPPHAVVNKNIFVPVMDTEVADALGKELDEVYTDLAKVNLQLRSYEASKRQDEAEKVMLNGQINLLTARKTGLETQLSLLNQSIDEGDVVISAMNVLVDKQYEEGKSKDAHSAVLADRLKDARNDYVSKSAEADELNAVVNQRDSEIAGLKEDNDSFLEAYEHMETVVGQRDSEIAGLKEDNDSFLEAYEHMEAVVEQKNVQLSNVQKNADNLVERIADKNAEIAELKETVAQDEEAIVSYGKAISEKDRLLAEQRDLNAGLNVENSAYQRRVRNISDALAKAEDSVVAKTKEIASKDNVITGLNSVIQNDQDDILNLEETVVDQKFDNHNLNRHIDNLKTDMAHNHERFDSWEYWAGMGCEAAIDAKSDVTKYNAVLFNFTQAMNRAGGNVKPYLDFGNACLNMLQGNMADDAISALSDALDNCRLSRKEKRKVLELRADLYRFTGQRKAAVNDWKAALGGWLGWFADMYSGSGIKRSVLKHRIKELAPFS